MKTAALFLLGLSVSAQAPLPSYKDLRFPPLRKITLPTPVTFSLPNGMKVYLLENHELPLVNGTALVRTGNLFDPSDKHGLADITGMVMRTGGTRSKTGEQLDAQLENIAASVESQIGESSGSVSFSCLKENTAEVLSVFKDVLTAPEFRQDQVNLAKTQWKSSIARRNDDPSGILSREFAATIYGKNNAYGWDINYRDINAITRDDLKAFYERYFYPANIMLAVYGDFSAADMKASLEKLFGGWNYGPLPSKPFPPVEAKSAAGIYLAEKSDVTQTFFEIGHLGGELRDKDFAALSVAADILGGGFSSRLVRRVRTALGYAYDISANWGANYDHPGLFAISGSTQSKYTEATLQVIHEEVEKMRTAEVTDEELKTAKDAVENSFVFAFDRPSKTLSRLVTYAYYGYPTDFIFQYQKNVAAVTKADVLRAAKEHWHPNEFTIVAVGNPKDFGTPLSALNLPIQKIDLTIPEDKPAVAAQEPAATPVQAEKGQELLARAEEAAGGKSKLEAVRDFQSTMDAELNSPAGKMKISQTYSFLAPSTFRGEMTLPFGKQTVFSDGANGWMVMGNTNAPLPPPVRDQIQGQVFHQLVWLLLSGTNPNRTVSAVGSNTVRIADKNGESATLELNPATGLPAKLTYASPSSGANVEETYSDWREVDGMKLPFHLDVKQGGNDFAILNVQQYRINPGLKSDELSKKP